MIPSLITRRKRAEVLQEFVFTLHRYRNVWSELVVWHPAIVSEERKTLKKLIDPVLKQVSQKSSMNCPLELISSC